MDHLNNIYHKFENWHYRKQYLALCQVKCLQYESVFTRHFNNCWNGCKLYVDGEENDFDQKCDKYIEIPDFIFLQKKVFRAEPQQAFEACKKGMKAMQQQYKRAQIQNNGKATLLKSWQEFTNDPMKVILSQQAYNKPVQKQVQKAVYDDLWQ